MLSAKLLNMVRFLREESDRVIAKFRQKIEDNTAHIKEYGMDLPEIDEWAWKRPV